MRNCNRCGELLPDDAFYFVSKKLGTRRGQCKSCMSEIKAEQKDPSWLPECNRCGRKRQRSGPGRRLCQECFDSIYDEEDRRENGAHRLKLNPCPACGSKRLRADHVKGTNLCPVCRGVPQGRRTRLSRFFNVNPREYLELLAEQRNLCAICERPFTKSRVPHVDHRHGEPRLVRGLLCGPCNTLLAMAKDSSTRLRSAAAYLEGPPAQRVFPGREANEIADRRSEGHRSLRRAA